jgi:transcription elongation factor Elf1
LTWISAGSNCPCRICGPKIQFRAPASMDSVDTFSGEDDWIADLFTTSTFAFHRGQEATKNKKQARVRGEKNT